MICAPLMAESVEQMLSDMHQAKMEGADVVEIRLGCISDFQPHRDLKLLLENKPLPVVVVYGPTWEGGEYEGDEQERLQALLLAKDLGADYIELELKVASAFMKEDKLDRLNSKIIVSCYLDSLASLGEDIHCLIAEMRSMNADIIKFVSGTMIAYCTGERGLISQLLSFKFGGVFAYGSLEGTEICGLPSIDSLRQAYGVKNIDKNTVVFGLISKPVSHSKGPILHNPTFRHVCYNGIYVPMLVDDLKAFFIAYTSSDFAGFSVGIPYKEAVIDFCDEVHPCSAGLCLLAFARWVKLQEALLRAKSLAAAVSGKALPFEDLIGFRPEKDAILANATPLGMHQNTDRIPVPEETLRDYKLVFDAVYTPRKTRLLKEAKAAGAIVVSGVEMFLRQATAQFSLFTGHKAPEEFMRGIILEKF
ncbi:UNVERIFIED_CONTAM: Bifunctional 3-dehydroquinate dehydratase/shikimate dehydrogenase, chloroplastic [Sesamum calycinum]|uniref:Bifunctional 3-dehydroquinate dehydratase/shikimate dehydrogenase, chloroplastic n=1 Tax=Sesamum calycinum TaxID=2727403 RepID=A0AAW2SY86_9LAMI